MTRQTPAPRAAGRTSLFRALPRAALALAPALGGCMGPQSALNPAADDAAKLLLLTEIMTVGGALIFTAVMIFVGLAVWAPPRWRGWLARRETVVAGGIVFPVLTLTALLIYGLWLMRVTNAPAPGGDALTITVTGEQYWWRVHYPAEGDAAAFATANEVQVPVGRPVRILLEAADVVHAFWIPNYAGKVDMIPGRQTAIQFTPDRPGQFRGLCTEFCGDQHARMAFDVVALPPAEFAAWRQRQATDAAPPAAAFTVLGREVFTRSGCGSCHAVRGSDAKGELGPDLTHVGSRRSIGAGLYPTNIGTLAGWISGTQQLKPGARMPSYGSLSGEELRAVAGYLDQLK
ncbi:cytochrome c oxidase subunit II [Enterovirga sp.]|uniref:cytochrome c oxidase subunit II n=1 Tax=Enterovirga sp. TaxID=2026350 RepID=UPI00260F3D73|nr:cytochrome c oxidase subunit II [Enterovirga sp.]MDB5590128.1 cytochrome c oxidase subunit [Enterovirga sp.]